MSLSFIHANLANTMMLFMLIAGTWGVVLHFRKQGIGGNYWGILAVGELLVLAQGALGAFLWLGNARPGRMGVHILYGMVSVLALPAYYALTRGRDDRNAALAYGLLCLFLTAIALRAAATGVG